MNFDRNTVIGFVILALLFFGFFYYNNQQQIALQKEKATKDSIARVTDSLQQLKQPKANPALAKTDSVRADSIDRLADSNSILRQIPGATEQLTLVENELMKVWFTNKGGQPKKVELKNYKGPDRALGIFNTFLPYSMTAICMPRQMPKNGKPDSLAYFTAVIFPSTPL